jgi:hypothetical protein
MRINGFTAGIVCSVALCFMPSAFAAEPDWELAPPDAKILVGIDIRGLKNSQVTNLFGADAKSGLRTEVENIAPMGPFPIPKFELFEDIDSLFLASNAEKITPRPLTDKVESTVPVAATANTNPSFLLAISGTFPDEHIRPLLKGPHPSYKGINVYRGTGPNPIAVAVLDEHLVLLGDEKSIYRAIDRKTTGIKLQGGPIFARAKELAAANDVWVVVRDIGGDIKKASGPSAAFASEVDGVDFGLAARDAFNLNIAMTTKTDAGAQMFAQLISSQLQSAIDAKMDDQEAAEVLKRIKVNTNGNTMQVQIAMSKEELLDNIRKMQEQRARGGVRLASHHPMLGVTTTTTATRASVAVPAAPPAPPKPRIIKIYGLDDGTKEIQLDKTN